MRRLRGELVELERAEQRNRRSRRPSGNLRKTAAHTKRAIDSFVQASADLYEQTFMGQALEIGPRYPCFREISCADHRF
jgi:hypothetical protein